MGRLHVRGTLDFDLTFELLGERVTRKARADYSHTPEWNTSICGGRPHTWAGPGAGLCIIVRTVPDKDGTGGGPSWETIDVLDVGEIWEILDDAIEERCRAEDAKRRWAAARKAGAQ